jgi:hypothetical protein
MTLLNILSFQGEVVSLLSRGSRATGFEKSVAGQINLTFAGPEGDCHSGLTRKSDSRTLPLYKRDIDIRNVRQITILAEEELADIAQRLNIPKIDPAWFGANMVVKNIPDFTLLLVVDMENYPCSQIAKVVERHHPGTQFNVVKAAMHKRGLTAWVEREGDINTGDKIKIVTPPNRLYPHA